MNPRNEAWQAQPQPPAPYPTAGYPAYPTIPLPPKTSWWKRLPTVGKVALIVVPVLVLCCGGLTTVGALVDPPAKAGTKSAPTNVAAPPAGPVAVGPADSDPTPTDPAAATPGSTSQATPTPGTSNAGAAATSEIKTVTETQSIAYSTKRVNDSSLAIGTTKVRTAWVRGVKTLTYRLTLTNGVQTTKQLISSAVTKKPVTKVIAVGTKPTSSGNCDPNYTPCVPIASDVDCAGGSGNGPAYVNGPVYVIGNDIYDLDRDGDGVGCD